MDVREFRRWRIAEVVASKHFWLHLGLRDIEVRYAHTVIGPWISAIGVVLAGFASGLVIGQGDATTLRSVVSIQLVKFSLWWLIASAINDAVAVIETDRLTLLNSTMSSGLLVMRLAFRNFLLATHVQGAVMLVYLLMGEWNFLIRSIFLGPVFLVICLALYGPMLLLAHLGARSTTLIRLMPPMTQLLMFLSPVLWGTIAAGALMTVLEWNPAYWMITGSVQWVMDGSVDIKYLGATFIFLLASLFLAEILLRKANEMRLKIA